MYTILIYMITINTMHCVPDGASGEPTRQETTSFCHSGRRQYDASGGGTATTFPVEEKKEQKITQRR
jgi:hypothetical protein